MNFSFFDKLWFQGEGRKAICGWWTKLLGIHRELIGNYSRWIPYIFPTIFCSHQVFFKGYVDSWCISRVFKTGGNVSHFTQEIGRLSVSRLIYVHLWTLYPFGGQAFFIKKVCFRKMVTLRSNRFDERAEKNSGIVSF